MAALGRIWADDLWDTGIWNADIWAVAFSLLSVNVPASGTTIRIGFSTAATIGAGGNGGFAVTLSGGACTLTYASGSGTPTLVYTTSRTVAPGETGTLAYTQPTNGVEDSQGNDLASFSGVSINIPRIFDRLSVNRSLKRSINGSINT